MNDPNAKANGDKLLEFISLGCKEAANKYCAPIGHNSDTLLDSADFYEKNPVVFELNSKVKQDPEKFNHFTEDEQCIFFALEPSVSNKKLIWSLEGDYEVDEDFEVEPVMDDDEKDFKVKPKMDNKMAKNDGTNRKQGSILSNLIQLQSRLIDDAQNYLQLRKSHINQDCVINIEKLLKKDWNAENNAFSDLFDEFNEFNDEFYKRARDEIIQPKINRRLETFEQQKYFKNQGQQKAGKKTKSKKLKNNAKKLPRKAKITKCLLVTRPNTATRRTRTKHKKKLFTRRPNHHDQQKQL
jgi:hypothetical protein